MNSLNCERIILNMRMQRKMLISEDWRRNESAKWDSSFLSKLKKKSYWMSFSSFHSSIELNYRVRLHCFSTHRFNVSRFPSVAFAISLQRCEMCCLNFIMNIMGIISIPTSEWNISKGKIFEIKFMHDENFWGEFLINEKLLFWKDLCKMYWNNEF